MLDRFSKFLDQMSNFLAHRKGLVPLIGSVLVLLNFFVQFLPLGGFAESDFFLHLGVIVAIIGFMLAWAL